MLISFIEKHDYVSWEKTFPKYAYIDKDQTLIQLCRGKNVLHLGACDSPFHKEKARKGDLLHQKVRNVSRYCVGVDQDEEAITWLRDNCGINDIVAADASKHRVPFGNKSIDVVLCCDIIEHICDLNGFIEICKSYMGKESLLVITTINATALKPAIRAICGREAVHQDHISYYSFGTLCQLLNRFNMIPYQFGAFNYPTVTIIAKLLFNTLAKFAPGTADGILITAKRDDKRMCYD